MSEETTKATITLDLEAFEGLLKTLDQPMISADDIEFIREHFTGPEIENQGKAAVAYGFPGMGVMRGQRVAVGLRAAVTAAIPEESNFTVTRRSEWLAFIEAGGVVPDDYPEIEGSEAPDDRQALLILLAEALEWVPRKCGACGGSGSKYFDEDAHSVGCCGTCGGSGREVRRG